MTTRIVLTIMGLAAGAFAAPTFSLRSQRYFGAANDRIFDTGSLAYTGFTNESLGVFYNFGEYIGSTSMRGPDAVFSASTSVSLASTVVTENPAGFLARDLVTIRDSVLVTGGAGNAYLSPVIRVAGGFADNSPELYAGLNACFGTGSCVILRLPNGFSTGGIQNLDFIWSPSPQIFPSAFGFTFGVPVSTLMFLGTSVAALGGQGVVIAPGANVLGNFEFQLLGYRVLDANDNEILGASVESGFLAAPEPAPAAPSNAGLALIFFRRRR